MEASVYAYAFEIYWILNYSTLNVKWYKTEASVDAIFAFFLFFFSYFWRNLTSGKCFFIQNRRFEFQTDIRCQFFCGIIIEHRKYLWQCFHNLWSRATKNSLKVSSFSSFLWSHEKRLLLSDPQHSDPFSRTDSPLSLPISIFVEWMEIGERGGRGWWGGKNIHEKYSNINEFYSNIECNWSIKLSIYEHLFYSSNLESSKKESRFNNRK